MSSLLSIWEMSPIQVYQKLLPHLSGIDTDNIKLKLVSHDITGDKLPSLTHQSLDFMDIKKISHQNVLLRAIAEIYDSDTFCAFICSFHQLKPYQHLFKQSKIDLNTFKKYGYSKWKFLNDDIISIMKANLNILTINVQCCRNECTSYIQWSNYTELLLSAINTEWSNYTELLLSPQGYIMHESMKCELSDPESFYRYINGQYYRIFCSSCVLYLKRCDYEECNNLDSEVVDLRPKYQIGKMCYAHPKCKRCKKLSFDTCNSLHKKISCDTCNQLYCWECLIFINKRKNNKMNCVKYKECPECWPGSDYARAEIKRWLSTFGETHICYSCIEKAEPKQIMEAINDANHDLCDIIVYIIAEYAIGYVTICCNKHNKCRNDIFIPTTAALVMNKNGNDKAIYHWEPENVSFNDIRRPRVSMNGKLMRIFCYECSHRLNKCKVVDCGQLEVGAQCGEHSECIECGSDDLPQYTCVDCSHTLCTIHSAAGNYYKQKFRKENKGKLLKKGMCRSCGIEREIKSLSNIIKTATGMHMNNVHLNVFICIAQFALGCVVSCCNSYHKCNNEIILDNKFDFNHKTISNGNYDAYWYRSNGYCDVKPAVNIWGERYRIFCSDCNTRKLKNCRRYNCYNCECPDNTKKGCNPICCAHDLCKTCGIEYDIKCGTCDGLYCKKCSVKIGNRCYHELCALKKSFDNLSYDILEALQFRDEKFNMKIAKCVTEYANGYIAECCNEINECKNDIYINNIWDLKTKKDCDNNPIYYYVPKYFTWNKPMSIVNRKEIRIFCKDCTPGQLKKCDDDKCDRKETLNPNISYCLMHRCCLKCGKSRYSDLLKCSKCTDLYCNDHLSEKQCINCYYTMEYKAKKSAIHIALNKQRDFYHQFIVNLITEYSMGFSTKCCNNKCEKEICFNNEWEFRFKKDCENNYKEIQYYSPKYPMKNAIIRIVNQQNYRIFCNDCNNDTILTKCEYEQCENYEIIDRSTSTKVICGVHLE